MPEFLNMLELLIIMLCAVGCAVSACYYQRQRGTVSRLRDELNQLHKHLLGLERDLGALVSCSRHIGDRIGDGERSRRTLQKQLDRLQFSDDNQLAVEHAMKLLNSGLPLKEITDICDLTAGEIDILQNLSRHRQAA